MRLAQVLPWRYAPPQFGPASENPESQIFMVQTELASARTHEKRSGTPSKEVDRLVERLADLYLQKNRK